MMVFLRLQRYFQHINHTGSSHHVFFGHTEFALIKCSEQYIVLAMVTGLNMRKKYEQRLRGAGEGLEVYCNNCEGWHSHNNFHIVKGKYKSICKICHSSKYGKGSGYKAPSHIRKSEQAHKRKQKWLLEDQRCTSCGEVRPRKDFYNERQKAYLPYCCSTRRTWEQIEVDIQEQMKTCFECGLRLSFDEFSFGPNGRDKKRPYCKCCNSARIKMYSDRPERMEQIRETDDGSITVKILSDMLRHAEHCDHCGVRMTQDYPVTPSNKTIDHDVPLSRGGKHILSNITIMCLSCNSAKQTRTLDEFSRVKKKMVQR